VFSCSESCKYPDFTRTNILIFIYNASTIAITAVRLHTLLTLDFLDFSYASTTIFVWTTVEWGTAIVITCAPTFRPVLEKWFPNSAFRRRGTDTKYKLSAYGSGQRTFNSRNPNTLKAFDRIEDDEEELVVEQRASGATKVHISAGGAATGTVESETIPSPKHSRSKSGITVENEWDVKSDSLHGEGEV